MPKLEGTLAAEILQLADDYGIPGAAGLASKYLYTKDRKIPGTNYKYDTVYDAPKSWDEQYKMPPNPRNSKDQIIDSKGKIVQKPPHIQDIVKNSIVGRSKYDFSNRAPSTLVDNVGKVVPRYKDRERENTLIDMINYDEYIGDKYIRDAMDTPLHSKYEI